MMTEQEIYPLNLNEAGPEELTSVPGIGPSLAARIVAGRPYSSLDDLTRVQGISPRLLDKIGPMLSLQPGESEPEREAEAENGAALVPLAEPEVEELALDVEPVVEPEIPAIEATTGPEEPPAQETAPPPGREKAAPRYVTASQSLWMAFASGLFAFVLAVALTLGILVSLNGGLRFASDSQAASLSARMEEISSQAAVLDENMGGLRTRMDNLETLGGRVTTLEEASGQLEADFSALSGEVEAFGAQVEDLDGQVSSLQDDSLKYQSFLDGLYDFLHGFVEEAPNE